MASKETVKQKSEYEADSLPGCLAGLIAIPRILAKKLAGKLEGEPGYEHYAVIEEAREEIES